MSGGTFTMPSSMFLISQSSSNRFRSDTSMSDLGGLFVLIRGGGGWLLSDLVRLCPDLVLSPLVILDSRPMPESWLEFELFLEDSSLFALTSLPFLWSPLVLLVGADFLTTFPLLEVRLTFLGLPLGEFFSAVDRDNSLLLVCGVLPAPEVVLGPGEPEDPFETTLLGITRLLEALPPRPVRTGEFSGFAWRRHSPASLSVSRDFIFMFNPSVSTSSGTSCLYFGLFFSSQFAPGLPWIDWGAHSGICLTQAAGAQDCSAAISGEKRGWKLRHTRPSWAAWRAPAPARHKICKTGSSRLLARPADWLLGLCWLCFNSQWFLVCTCWLRADRVSCEWDDDTHSDIGTLSHWGTRSTMCSLII